jgi:transcriptional regulator with GAF, ATPase, and Fis domain
MSETHSAWRADLAELENCLFDAFEIQATVQRFSNCLQPSVEFDRWGIATRVSQSELQVLALYSKGQVQPDQQGRRFSYHGTVGEWVWRRKRSFIGKQRSEVKSFPSTFKQFEHDGMESNCVIPLPLPDRGPTIAYWMSRRANCYTADNLRLLQRACEYLKPLLVNAATIERVYRLSSNPLERAMSQLFSDGGALQASATALPTLDEVQAHYIRRVLASTNWTVEGANGAAAIMGLPASTLRSRMKKLGISRD